MASRVARTRRSGHPDGAGPPRIAARTSDPRRVVGIPNDDARLRGQVGCNRLLSIPGYEIETIIDRSGSASCAVIVATCHWPSRSSS